jgi:hypothetical protein
MPESVSTVDAILDGLRDRATGWSCVPLADAEAAVHAAAGLGSPDERLREANGYEQRIAALDDLVQRAWSLIAAAMSGSPRQFSDEWKDSAERWEVDYCMGQGASGLRSRSSVGGGGVVSAVDADAPHQREPGEAPDTPGTTAARIVDAFLDVVAIGSKMPTEVFRQEAIARAARIIGGEA